MQWAPLNVPLSRRLQTFAVLCLVALPFVLIGINIVWCALWSASLRSPNAFPSLFTLPVLPMYLLYIGYIWYDAKKGTQGGRKSKWFRSWWVYKGCAAHLPRSKATF